MVAVKRICPQSKGKNCHLDDIFGQPEGSDGEWGEERAVVLLNVYIKRLHHPESKSELKNRSSLNMKSFVSKIENFNREGLNFQIRDIT